MKWIHSGSGFGCKANWKATGAGGGGLHLHNVVAVWQGLGPENWILCSFYVAMSPLLGHNMNHVRRFAESESINVSVKEDPVTCQLIWWQVWRCWRWRWASGRTGRTCTWIRAGPTVAEAPRKTTGRRTLVDYASHSWRYQVWIVEIPTIRSHRVGHLNTHTHFI